MLTLEPARAWGLHDRGMIREGLVADLNVIDPATVAPAMPRVVHDLPGGEKRIDQKSTGIAATFVANVFYLTMQFYYFYGLVLIIAAASALAVQRVRRLSG